MTRGDAGVEDRVARLFDDQYGALCRVAYLLLNDASLAEDVVQEAFLRTFSGWRRLRDPDRAERYLRRSVVNLCRSRFRHRDAGSNGQFAIPVAPGAYTVTAVSSPATAGIGRGCTVTPTQAIVRPGAPTTVAVSCDTGIR